MAASPQRSGSTISWKIVLLAGVAMFVFAIIQLVNGNWIFAIIQGLLGALFVTQGIRGRRTAQRP
jgi:uncharacterized membrane protein HdeD (DUF308 family)